MRTWSRFPALLAGAAILLVACNDGGPGGSNTGDQLSAAQATDVSDQLIGVALTSIFTGLASPSVTGGPMAASAAAVPFSVTVSNSEPCEGGGTISVSGTISGDVDQTGNGTLEMDFTENISNCVIMTDNGDATVNGDPSIRVQGSFGFAAGQISGENTLSMSGGFRFTLGELSGSCAIDFTIRFSQTSGSASGTVCGRSIDVSGTFG